MLVHVKAMCEAYYYGVEDHIQALCLLDRHAYQETLTLDEFSRRQFVQINATAVKLQGFIDQVAVLAANACQVSGRHRSRSSRARAAGFRERWNWKAFLFKLCSTLACTDSQTATKKANHQHHPRARQQRTISFLRRRPNQVKSKCTEVRSTDDPLLPLVEYGPTFAERKRWRDILLRLSEFLRLLDYIVLEFLRRLVKSSVRDLFIHIHESFMVEFKLVNTDPKNDEETDERFRLSREKSISSARSARGKQSFRPESRATLDTNPASEP